MRAESTNPPRHGEGDRPQGGGGESRFVARPEVIRARKLRRDMSLPERMLWLQLRQRPGGYKFRRQHPIGPYVVDFCCLAERYVVEVDGCSHDNHDRAKFDERRICFLKQNGYRVLRITAKRVLADSVGVANAIVTRAASRLHQPAAGPPPRAEEADS